MKRTLLILMTVACMSAQAQEGLRLNIRGAYNSTWLFNENVSDAGDELDYKSSFGGQFGVGALYNFTDHAGISLEVLFGSVNQKYTVRVDTGGAQLKFEAEDHLSTIDLPLLFRLTSEGGFYFEAGPQLSLINGAEFSVEGTSLDYPDDFVAGSYFSFLIGAGYDIPLGENFVLAPGLRFAWGFGDVFEDPGNTPGYEPTNAAVGGINLALYYKLGGAQ